MLGPRGMAPFSVGRISASEILSHTVRMGRWNKMGTVGEVNLGGMKRGVEKEGNGIAQKCNLRFWKVAKGNFED